MNSSSPIHNQSYINTGHGPVVILLHGLFGNLGMWQPMVNALKDDYQVVVPRLPLFELTLEQANIKFLTTVLHDFVEWNRLKDVTLIGHAMGGQLALLYTHLYPDNVNKVVLISSSGLMEKSPFLDPESAYDTYDYIHERVTGAFYQKEFVSDKLVNEIYGAVQSVPKRITLGSIARSSKQASVSSFLTKLDHPVLLLWGLDDKITPPEIALHFYDLLSNADMKFLNNCGHLPMVEKPDEVNQELLSFLRKSR